MNPSRKRGTIKRKPQNDDKRRKNHINMRVSYKNDLSVEFHLNKQIVDFLSTVSALTIQEQSEYAGIIDIYE
jgi:hypothetical protein